MPREGIMLCYPLEERRLERWLSEDKFVYIQPKLDGDRGRVLFTRQGVRLMSSEGNDRNFSLPHLVDELERNREIFESYGIFELDGEFYNHDLSHEQIHGICSRTTERHPDHAKVEFHVFDHIAPVPQQARVEEVFDVMRSLSSDYLKYVLTGVAQTPESIMAIYDRFVQNGYEGIIVRRPFALYKRKRSIDIMKFKPKRMDEYTIVGYREEFTISDTPKNRLGALELVDPEGTIFSVSAGLNDNDRNFLWAIREELIGKKCIVHYQAVTAKGIPKFATDVEVKL